MSKRQTNQADSPFRLNRDAVFVVILAAHFVFVYRTSDAVRLVFYYIRLSKSYIQFNL
jgi:hypothetical protein